MKINKPINKNKIIFPNTSADVISEIVKKYGLEQTQEQMLEKMDIAKTFSEKEKIFENLPSRQTAKIVRQVGEETISIEEFPYEIQKALDIPLEKAKKISLELYKKVIALAEKATSETKIKKNTGSTIKIKPAPKEFIEKPERAETIKPIRPTRIKQPRKQTGEDRYRETIE